jgi:hypothetical protein
VVLFRLTLVGRGPDSAGCGTPEPFLVVGVATLLGCGSLGSLISGFASQWFQWGAGRWDLNEEGAEHQRSHEEVAGQILAGFLDDSSHDVRWLWEEVKGSEGSGMDQATHPGE